MESSGKLLLASCPWRSGSPRKSAAEFLTSCLDRNAAEVVCAEILAPAEGAWNAGKSRAYIYIFRPDVQTKYRLPIFDVTLSLRENFSKPFWPAKKWSALVPSQTA